ncbi:X-ray repair cross-complementing protein 5 [Stomoxys calcitrans]|uniref:X-ray repair cross-complementing protein 5 n=1 Tax=Stomoxys calcitrans TaxID=35570 RepID=UPI0027E2F26D|nr:X-ray repair cross-complementing protein 5 [Stomoxys calcitrans]
MAYNKEYMIMILDNRRSTSEEFKEKAVKCCSDIIKQKICCGKKDYLSFVLVGSERTYNDVNTNEDHDGYLNIVQYVGDLEMPSWQLLMNFYQFVNEPSSDEGEWLDALVVAYGMLRKGMESSKIQRLRLVLFYDFNDGFNSYDSYKDITESLLTDNVDLIVISPNICFIDNPANDYLPQAIFSPGKKSDQCLENEKHALRLVSQCNAKLCNLNEGLSAALKFKNKRPWTWNNKLRIGSKICINITGVIHCKNECTIKLKKIWNEPGEVLVREWGHFIHGNQVTVEKDDLMEGYMLGGSAIPYDESVDDDKIKLAPGLTFMGFIPRKLVYDEYFAGESTYLILHQRGMTSSAKKLDALVRVLLEMDRAILCWKVYSEKFNKARIVVLLPNELEDDCPATLSMIEMAHHSQYHFFEFPKLANRHTECSKEQLDAVDHLIDTMDLTLKSEDSQTPRDTFEKDLLSFTKLPHIFERNFMDIMERKILCKASEDDEQFQEMLKDKNFVEAFWKLPEHFEKDAKDAAKKVKKLFPLTESDEWQKKLRARENRKEPLSQNTKDKDNSNNNGVQLSFDHVRSSTPAEDFEQLLKAYVFPIHDSTQRDVKFNYYATQLCGVVKDMIFKTDSLTPTDFEKIAAALSVYRKRCFIFNAFDDYNKYVTSIKAKVVERNLNVFWDHVIVKHELGLCFIGEPSLDEQIKEKDFYSLEFADAVKLTPEEMEMNDPEMDEMLANINEEEL